MVKQRSYTITRKHLASRDVSCSCLFAPAECKFGVGSIELVDEAVHVRFVGREVVRGWIDIVREDALLFLEDRVG